MISLDSAKGPSMTVRCAPLNRTRLALEVGVSPSPASITPAFTSSSLNFIILPISSALGIVPASEFLSPGTSTITRIFVLLAEGRGFQGLIAPSDMATNEAGQDRHGVRLFLAGPCERTAGARAVRSPSAPPNAKRFHL